MILTKNFSKKEFESKDGAEMPSEVLENIKELATNLQVLRDELNAPITINSGYRSPKHNFNTGGVSQSQHLTGKASDIVADGYTPQEVAVVIEELIKSGKMKQGGLKAYQSFVHYDIRGIRARW